MDGQPLLQVDVHLSFRSHLTDTVPAFLPLLQAGGQRLVQVVVYLNSLQPDQGGETRFFNPLLKGLAIQVGALQAAQLCVRLISGQEGCCAGAWCCAVQCFAEEGADVQ